MMPQHVDSTVIAFACGISKYFNLNVPSNQWLVCPDHMKKQSDYCNTGLVEDSVKEPVS